MVVVVLGQGDGVARRHAAGDDADLVHAVAVFEHLGDDGVPRLVVGGYALVAFGDHAALLGGTRDDLVDRLGDILHVDELAVGAGGKYRRFVEQILDIRAREPRGEPRQALEVDVGSERLVAAVHLEDLFASLDIGNIDIDLPVEPARSHESGVEDIRAVGRRHDDYAVAGLEAVHLNEQLVERLFALVVAAAQTRASLSAHRVDLVDEHYAGHTALGLLEQVAHARRAHAYEHLHEVRAADGEERHAGFARDRLCEKGLARSGRADEQHTLGDTRADGGELLGIFQEIHDLLELLLFLFGTRDIGEPHLAVPDLGRLGLAEVECLVVRAVGFAHYDDEHHREQRHHDDGQQQRGEQRRPGRIVEHQADGGSVPARLFDLAVPAREGLLEISAVGDIAEVIVTLGVHQPDIDRIVALNGDGLYLAALVEGLEAHRFGIRRGEGYLIRARERECEDDGYQREHYERDHQHRSFCR